MTKNDNHTRPVGTSDDTVTAVGKVSEALEWVERARGHLYEFHQLMGRADFIFSDASELLAKAGHKQHSELVDTEVVGRNVLPGMWTFQTIEEFEDTYYMPVKEAEASIRNQLMQGKRHVFESELKEKRRTKNLTGHESRPHEKAASNASE